jgi:hypothetical protein
MYFSGLPLKVVPPFYVLLRLYDLFINQLVWSGKCVTFLGAFAALWSAC